MMDRDTAYGIVIADLRARRREIDRTIAMLRQVYGVPISSEAVAVAEHDRHPALTAAERELVEPPPELDSEPSAETLAAEEVTAYQDPLAGAYTHWTPERLHELVKLRHQDPPAEWDAIAEAVGAGSGKACKACYWRLERFGKLAGILDALGIGAAPVGPLEGFANSSEPKTSPTRVAERRRSDEKVTRLDVTSTPKPPAKCRPGNFFWTDDRNRELVRLRVIESKRWSQVGFAIGTTSTACQTQFGALKRKGALTAIEREIGRAEASAAPAKPARVGGSGQQASAPQAVVPQAKPNGVAIGGDYAAPPKKPDPVAEAIAAGRVTKCPTAYVGEVAGAKRLDVPETPREALMPAHIRSKLARDRGRVAGLQAKSLAQRLAPALAGEGGGGA